ncbi:MAG: group II intron reverse transcriptase/maturase [Moorea sp. SIO4G2]|uniref:group II intron reverse transcriptase/maturase n=1 Tax=unclassified Moorena TaxID=2683338 RepID=UPI0013C9A817|nr:MULTISPECIES: group II intron reverse transcriptase/maturase [unclassified Moorena]NEO62661.1 group II intron reverse transcriptase/maturase [Moorena sp. SIO4G2]NEO17757.1 group II intron reverse transcriptase/maturase [Moorena sp. SIO3E8]NEO25129.1 group II intron reverse transcriptase/maturase [Moorena sp. SIO4A5]NEQ04312.1 group II intron reverse transcriptase/maturase [Moorena sp. SIO3F7]NEQ62429.1 group II intron reverse transcriptase/maturase [Moorena sp. SIO4A1]
MSKTRGFAPQSEWSKVDWRKLEITVFKLQKRIYRASQRGDSRVVRKLQKTMMKSWSAKMVAVRKVTQQNKGKKTAGIDGKKALTNKQRLTLVANLKLYKKPQPTRRVWIDKPGRNEKRPLGIPTIYDRALQALTKLALEPEWEAVFEPNSYGFRPGRSCHDAIETIFLGINKMPKWVLDADISKCFDKINHDVLLGKLNTYPSMKRLIKNWLKAGVMDNRTFNPTDEGTPQGGIISPLLANIALHGMEERIKEFARTLPGQKAKNVKALNFVRYADDFIIMHKSKEVVEECLEIIKDWLKDIGLELKPSKTRITHTFNGYDFLGFNIRQYEVGKHQSNNKGYKTLIKPSQKKVKEHYERLAKVIDNHKAAPQAALISKLRPIITGWCNYNRSQVSKKIFSKLDHLLCYKLQRWGYRRHPNKSKTWVNNKYWGTKVEKPQNPWDARKIDNWVFMTGEENYLPKHAKTPVVRHVKVKESRSTFDGDLIYWSNRMQKHPEMSTQKGKLLKRQKGKCAHCGLTFRSEDLIEKHHIIPRALGGSDLNKNLELLHLHCHDAKHRTNVKPKCQESSSDSSELDDNPF